MKRILLLFTLLTSILTIGQDVVDVKADYINFIDGDFYVYLKSDTNHYKIYEVEIINLKTILEFSELIHSDRIAFNELIDVRSSNKSLESIDDRNLIHGEYFFEDEIGSHLLKINKFFGAYMYVDIEHYPDSFIESSTQIKLIPIRLNKEHLIYYTPNLENEYLDSDSGVIYIKEDSIFFNNFKLNYLEEINLSTNQKDLINTMWYSTVENYIETEKSDEVEFIFEEYGIKLDSLDYELEHSYFVVGYSGGKLKIYNSWLEDISHDDLRDIDGYNNYSLQFLENNSIKFLLITGEVYDKPITQRIFYCGLSRNVYDTEISNNNGKTYLTYYASIENPNYISKENLSFEEIDSLYISKIFEIPLDPKFIHQNPSFAGNKDTQLTVFNDYKMVPNNFIVSNSKDGSYLITPFELYSETTSDSYSINHRLIVNYEKQQEYEEIKFTFNNRLIVINKNLKGYLGINDAPEYKELELFQGNYARFEYPDGLKGWLKVDGTEFIDQ